ncbi:MAG: hypothetical protein AAGK77_03195 [Pseudomonadota bacterium]
MIGVGVLACGAKMRRRLSAQYYLTILMEPGPDCSAAEIAESMTHYVAVEDGNGPLIVQTKIASLAMPARGVTPQAFTDLIECRSSSPSLKDIIRRVALDSSCGDLVDWPDFNAAFETAHRKTRDDSIVAALTPDLEGY